MIETHYGGFAEVQILQYRNGTRIAKKVLTRPEMSRRFKREVDYLRKFNHPNIVRLLDANLEDSPPWYVMPAAKYTFGQVLDSIKNVEGILFGILDGLQEIHSKGVSHRDLKPNNILLFENPDGTLYSVISDFGLVVNRNASDTTQLTSVGAIGGTEGYAAPECYGNFGEATQSSDIYSFGAMLYRVYVNKMWFPYSELTCDGPLGYVIQRCTYRNQNERFNDIIELRAALYEALEKRRDDNYQLSLLTALDSIKANDFSNLQSILTVLKDLTENEGFKDDFFAVAGIEFWSSLQQISLPHFNMALENFVKYMISSGLAFSYCDVLGDKAKQIFSIASEDHQAKIAVGVLALGINHNRFYVEKIFLDMASKNISDTLASKIKSAANLYRVDLYDIRRACESNSVPLTSIHRMLVV
ncbi:MAG: serine/threonine protein kinase [Desulfovibrio sp.]|uniref:serine/threonine protein kinase n=1 Tax=Desulfovibrio sp. TaxID=885 RepID=UPI0025911FA9|nr:serine/threonine-protein kinase [Desulfovibrio sp.]MCD7983446.1 serine/threonine protein kinase [Desulfovibrio sp.]